MIFATASSSVNSKRYLLLSSATMSCCTTTGRRRSKNRRKRGELNTIELKETITLNKKANIRRTANSIIIENTRKVENLIVWNQMKQTRLSTPRPTLKKNRLKERTMTKTSKRI
jgi:hypothetical protein